MKAIDKIRWMNKGMKLQKSVDIYNELFTSKKEYECISCPYYNIFEKMLREKRIYAGTADFVQFFETTIATLGLDEFIEYRVEDIDGKLEIVIGGKENA